MLYTMLRFSLLVLLVLRSANFPRPTCLGLHPLATLPHGADHFPVLRTLGHDLAAGRTEQGPIRGHRVQACYPSKAFCGVRGTACHS